jgi:hypothetical protein
MNITPGIFDNAAIYVRNFKDIEISEKVFKRNSNLFYISDRKLIVNFLKYIDYSFDDCDNECKMIEIYRKILVLYIKKKQFHWVSKINYGIDYHLFSNLSDDLRIIVDKYCNLLSDSYKSLSWWINNIYSVDDEKEKILQGIIGEKLTIFYEREILNINNDSVIYMAAKSSYSGFDISSLISNEDNRIKLIEVKTNLVSNINEARIFLTKKEWQTCLKSNLYFFYIWIIIQKKAYLYILRKKDIEAKVSIDPKGGSWQETIIDVSGNLKKINPSFEVKLNDKVYNF